MESLRTRIQNQERIVADGAMGTRLIDFGAKLDQSTALLNISQPEWVEKIHRDYVDAGAEMIVANTFGASPARLKAFGLRSMTAEINQRASDLAVRAAGGRAYIAISLGPCGLQNHNEAVNNFREQLRVIDRNRIDAVLIETMTNSREAIAAIEASREEFIDTVVMVSFVFAQEGNEVKLLNGESVEQVVQTVESASCDVIGANCGRGIEEMNAIAVRLKASTDLPAIIRPSAGLPEQDSSGKFIYPDTPDSFAPIVSRLWKMDVSIVGGCCGTTSDHIRVISQLKNSV